MLTLNELRAFDPGVCRGAEMRFCCPLPACAGKKKTPAHRSLAVNARTGAYQCHRCGARGKLAEEQRAAYRPRFPAPSTPSPSDWTVYLAGMRSYVDAARVRQCGWYAPECDSAAAAYLRSRGISPIFPLLCGARHHPDWCGGGPAVVFPIRDQQGALVAAQGRYVQPRAGQPKVRSVGMVTAGLFSALTALEQPVIVICEAPIDALSLAEAGIPTVATCGAKLIPAWLPAACQNRRVVLAQDNDAAGHAGADALRARLQGTGHGSPVRLCPPVGDWNDTLCRYGAQALRAEILAKLRGEGFAMEG